MEETATEPTSILSQFQKGEKMELDSEAFHTRTNTFVVKRQRKPRIKAGSILESPASPVQSPSTNDSPKDKGRGRYACLNHRMKHKRCPPDCKERRPKPSKGNSEPSSPADSSISQRNILQLEESQTQSPSPSSPIAMNSQMESQLPSIKISPLETMSALPSLDGPFNWDSVSWDSFMDDENNHSWNVESENWDDLKSSSHWETSKEFSPNEFLNDMDVGSPFVSGSSSEARSVSPMRRLLLRLLLTRETLERWISDPFFNKFFLLSPSLSELFKVFTFA